MKVAYSLVRQKRITAKDLFEKHADPFKTMGRELVICCDCGQPVMLRGSLGGQMSPHFAHYKLKASEIENAVPCEARVSGGSREYIKGEQRKHKTYGLGYLIRRFELYQSVALHRYLGRFIQMGVVDDGVEISSFQSPRYAQESVRELQKQGVDVVDRLRFEINHPPAGLDGFSWQDRQEILKLANTDMDAAKGHVLEQAKQYERDFIKDQTLFRSRLRLSPIFRNFIEPAFCDVAEELADTAIWKPAIEKAEQEDATLEEIEAGRRQEMVRHLFRYVSSRAAERSRQSVLFSALMHGTYLAFQEMTAEKKLTGASKYPEIQTFDDIQAKCITLARRATNEQDLGKRNEVSYRLLGLMFSVDALGADVGLNDLGERLYFDMKKALTTAEKDNLNRCLVHACIYLVPASLSQLPYREVFEDVLYRPHEIEQHYTFSNSDDGFIYLGHDPALDQIWHKPSVKIGKSIDPERRGRQLAGQCLPRPLRIHRVWYVQDMRKAEQTVFQNLQRRRAKGNKEIFHLQVHEAGSRIDGILRRANLVEAG